MLSTKDEGSQCLTLKPKNVEIREEIQLGVPIQSCLQGGLPSPDPLKEKLIHLCVPSFIHLFSSSSLITFFCTGTGLGSGNLQRKF